MRFTRWISGQINALCDECGRKFKSGELTTRWEGYKVCRDCWEIRNPQDLIRPMPAELAPPWTRPDVGETGGQNQFVSVTYSHNTLGCTGTGMCSLASFAAAGCWIVGNNTGTVDVEISGNKGNVVTELTENGKVL